MDTSQRWIIGIVLLVIAGGVVAITMKSETAFAPGQSTPSASVEEEVSTSSKKEEGNVPKEIEGQSTERSQSQREFTGKVLADGVTPLLTATQKDITEAKTKDKYVLLYFYANWCPTCKSEMNDAVLPAFNELKNPEVIGFRVNYNDNNTSSFEKQLAQEHGVAYQHTKVLLGPDGKQITKDPSTWTKNDYITNVNDLTSN